MANSTVTKTKTKRDGLYIHPKGSIKKPTKVSCASCISGHRSGACDHYDRILLQIRAAGRPSTTCHHQASCGGACLQQKAFIIPDETPQWCDEHRCCIENWDHSERCPEYPVSSSTKSAKRKERSNSPQVPVPMSPARSAGTSRHVAKSSISTSTCASEHARNGNHSLPPTAQVFSAVPGMIKASGSVSSTSWVPAGMASPSYRSSAHYDQRMLPQPASTFTAPPISFAETSSLNSLVSFDLPSTHDNREPWKPTYDPFLPNFSFEPPEHPHSLIHPPTTNPFSPPVTISTASSSYMPTAAAPLRQRTSPRQSPPQQTHPCPGNGFQCPCDENCMCQDCYTHQRGFWTLPFSFSDLPQDEYQSPPAHIAMPPSTFPESLQTHTYFHDHENFDGIRFKNSNGADDEDDEEDSKDKVFSGPKASCCTNLEHEDWLA